jgi:DnaJ-class molecular chaperone
MEKCPNCNGRKTLPAVAPIWDREPCPSCRRTGLVSVERGDWETCPKCNGYGWTGRKAAPEECPRCTGVGIIRPSTQRQTPYRSLDGLQEGKGVITGRDAGYK